jgi:hypothetical protein
MSFPSTDSAYEKISRIQGRNDAVEPMQVWLAKVKDKNQDVVLKIFDLNHRNADFLETIQVFSAFRKASATNGHKCKNYPIFIEFLFWMTPASL